MHRAGFVAKTRSLVAKDLLVEWRARDTLPPMLVFSIAVTLLLAFTLPDGRGLEAPVPLPLGTAPLAYVLAGFFWVTVLFAGLIGFARTFEGERAEGALDALLMAPLDRSGLFLAKALVNLIAIVTLQVFLLPLFALFFSLDLAAGVVPLIAVVLLVDLGYVVIGTLFSAVAARTRSRELVLPLLAFPMLVPVFIAGVELTSELIAGGSWGSLAEQGWFGILVAFDIVFGVAGALAFEFVLD